MIMKDVDHGTTDDMKAAYTKGVELYVGPGPGAWEEENPTAEELFDMDE